MSQSRVLLCKVSEVPPGEMKRVDVEGHDPMVLCNADGAFHLLDDECTHAIASLSEGDLEDHQLYCPLHGGSFDVRTGKATGLPCKHALRTFPVDVQDDGVWFVKP